MSIYPSTNKDYIKGTKTNKNDSLPSSNDEIIPPTTPSFTARLENYEWGIHRIIKPKTGMASAMGTISTILYNGHPYSFVNVSTVDMFPTSIMKPMFHTLTIESYQGFNAGKGTFIALYLFSLDLISALTYIPSFTNMSLFSNSKYRFHHPYPSSYTIGCERYSNVHTINSNLS